MKIRWTSEAGDRLEEICLHIAGDNPDAAIRTVNTIYEQVEQLLNLPNRCVFQGGTALDDRKDNTDSTA